MGINEGLRTWRRGAEEVAIKNQKNELGLNDLVDKSRVLASNYVEKNANLASVFVSAGHRDHILKAPNRFSTAKYIAQTEAHLVPDTIDDLDQQAAFLSALAEELKKPEYNQ